MSKSLLFPRGTGWEAINEQGDVSFFYSVDKYIEFTKPEVGSFHHVIIARKYEVSDAKVPYGQVALKAGWEGPIYADIVITEQGWEWVNASHQERAVPAHMLQYFNPE